MLNVETRLGKVAEARETKVCPFCYKGHNAQNCPDLLRLDDIPIETRGDIINKAVSELARSGIDNMGGSALQILLNKANEKERRRIVGGAVSFYKLGNFTKEKRGTEEVEKFTGSIVEMNTPKGEEMRVKVSANPIRYDNTFGEWVIFYQPVREDGSVSPVGKMNPLASFLTFKKRARAGV